MTTTAPDRASAAASRFGVARSFLDALAAQDFGRLGDALAAGVRLRALLPGGFREWSDAEAVADRFTSWFGDTEAFDFLQASADEVAGRLHLYWRLRLRAERLGAGWFTIEQQAYADIDDNGRIAHLDVLCTGYRREADHD